MLHLKELRRKLLYNRQLAHKSKSLLDLIQEVHIQNWATSFPGPLAVAAYNGGTSWWNKPLITMNEEIERARLQKSPLGHVPSDLRTSHWVS